MKNPSVNPHFQVMQRSGSTSMPMASSHRFLTSLAFHASPGRKQVLLCISPFRPGILKSSSTGTLMKSWPQILSMASDGPRAKMAKDLKKMEEFIPDFDERDQKILSLASDDSPRAKRAKDLKKMEEFMPNFDELDKNELKSFLELEFESSSDLNLNKHYEIVFLVPEKNANEVQAVLKKVLDFIKKHKGIVHRLDDWGMRNLAYKIKKASRANYFLMNIEINNVVINDLNTLFEKDERVIRHLVMSQKAAISKKSVPPEEYRPSKIGEEEQKKEDEDGEGEYMEVDEEEDDEEEEETELSLQRAVRST